MAASANEELTSAPQEVTVNAGKEVNCKDSLAEGFTQFFNDDSTSDITVVVGSKRYAVHKIILSASSKYFYRMFFGCAWKESTSGEVALQETPACEEVFDTFIRYFYNGTISLCPGTAPHVLTLADKYDAKVKQNCLEFIAETINSGDIACAVDCLPTCDQVNATEVLERCYAMICMNLQKASETPGWSSLSFEHILSILSRDDIIVSSEYNVYVAVQNWIESQEECQTEINRELLSRVKFEQMNLTELIQVEQSTLATGTAVDIMTQHLHKAYRYLAIKSENQEHQATDSNRVYIKDAKLQTIKISNTSQASTSYGSSTKVPVKLNCIDNVEPLLSSPNVVELYTWNLSYSIEEGKSVNFNITAPMASREVVNSIVSIIEQRLFTS